MGGVGMTLLVMWLLVSMFFNGMWLLEGYSFTYFDLTGLSIAALLVASLYCKMFIGSWTGR